MKKDIRTFMFSAGLLILIAIIFTNCSSTKSVSTLDKQDVAKMINEHSFIFEAEKMNPMRGRTRILTSSYDVRVNNDSLISFLPYFGRSYSAPMDPSKVITQFTSTDFTYDVKQLKEDQWRVTLQPRDRSSIQELSFLIFENGSATLQMVLTTSDAISFMGNLKKVE